MYVLFVLLSREPWLELVRQQTPCLALCSHSTAVATLIYNGVAVGSNTRWTYSHALQRESILQEGGRVRVRYKDNGVRIRTRVDCSLSMSSNA